MQRMLHAGCVQLGSWYERPARGVPLDAEELLHGLRRLQVVDVAALEKNLSSGLLLRRLSFVVRLGRLRSGVDKASGSLVVVRWLSEEVELVPMFYEVLPLAQCTSSFAPRHFRNAREGVALGARP
jgi:hypothetical protein